MRSLLLLVTIVRLVPAQSVDSFLKETFEQMLRNDPEFATTVGRHDYDNLWTDWTKAGRTQRRHFFEQRLSMVDAFSSSEISPENRLSLRVIQYDFRSRLDAWELETH